MDVIISSSSNKRLELSSYGIEFLRIKYSLSEIQANSLPRYDQRIIDLHDRYSFESYFKCWTDKIHINKKYFIIHYISFNTGYKSDPIRFREEIIQFDSLNDALSFVDDEKELNIDVSMPILNRDYKKKFNLIHLFLNKKE